MTLQRIEKMSATIIELEKLKTTSSNAINRNDSSLENFFHELYKSL